MLLDALHGFVDPQVDRMAMYIVVEALFLLGMLEGWIVLDCWKIMTVESYDTVTYHIETHIRRNTFFRFGEMLLGRALYEDKAVMMVPRSGTFNCVDYKLPRSFPSCCWIADIVGSVWGHRDNTSALWCIFPGLCHLEIKLLKVGTWSTCKLAFSVSWMRPGSSHLIGI